MVKSSKVYEAREKRAIKLPLVLVLNLIGRENGASFAQAWASCREFVEGWEMHQWCSYISS